MSIKCYIRFLIIIQSCIYICSTYCIGVYRSLAIGCCNNIVYIVHCISDSLSVYDDTVNKYVYFIVIVHVHVYVIIFCFNLLYML